MTEPPFSQVVRVCVCACVLKAGDVHLTFLFLISQDTIDPFLQTVSSKIVESPQTWHPYWRDRRAQLAVNLLPYIKNINDWIRLAASQLPNIPSRPVDIVEWLDFPDPTNRTRFVELMVRHLCNPAGYDNLWAVWNVLRYIVL